MFHLPEFIAMPLFRRIYPRVRKSEGSADPVTPLATIQVEPTDFPYLDQVQYCF